MKEVWEEEAREANQQRERQRAHGQATDQTNKKGGRLERWHRKLWRNAGRRRAQLFSGLTGPESTIATFLRTEVIGINAFLAKVGVPDV